MLLLINARQHWYAMRDIRGQWWNLNSQSWPAKVNGEIIWYLENMIQSGMHVFAVEGALSCKRTRFSGSKDGEYVELIAESEYEETNEIFDG